MFISLGSHLMVQLGQGATGIPSHRDDCAMGRVWMLRQHHSVQECICGVVLYVFECVCEQSQRSLRLLRPVCIVCMQVCAHATCDCVCVWVVSDPLLLLLGVFYPLGVFFFLDADNLLNTSIAFQIIA